MGKTWERGGEPCASLSLPHPRGRPELKSPGALAVSPLSELRKPDPLRGKGT